MRTFQAEPETDIARAILRETSDHRVLLADGYEVRLVIRRGGLHITDGIRTGKRTRIVSRADGVKRIIILAETGLVSLEALRWCELEGIGIAQYERDGHLVMLSGPSHGEAKALQAQAIASAGGLQAIRLKTARALLTAKLEGQARNALDILRQPSVAYLIDEHLRGLGKASTLKELSGYEGNAALAYWQAWTDCVHVPFPPESTLELPIHWNTYRGRPSGTRSVGSKRRNRSLDAPESANRGATDPINAMLNYAYRVAETEAKLACLAHGLGPGIGFMHLIESDRDAFALDLMEAARPICDAIVLSFLDTDHGIPLDDAGHPRYFSPDWCYESRHGVVRLEAPLTHMIAERCLDMAKAIEPHVRELSLALLSVRIPDLSAMQSGKASITDVRTRNARIAAYSPLQRMPIPSEPREVITDEQWEKIRIHVPIVKNLMGAKRLDDRLVLAAIVYATANGIPLTALPDSLRLHYRTAERRIGEWKSCGAWPKITRAIRANVLPGFSG